MTDAEVRFTVVDAILKGIVRCTKTMVTAEVSVRNLEEDTSAFTPKDSKALSKELVSQVSSSLRKIGSRCVLR